jgi:hypothetical protein
VLGRLVVLSLLVGTIVPASSAVGAVPRQPGPGPGSIGIRLVDVPADSRDNPLARSYIVGRQAPGTSVHRLVEIINSTGSTAVISVYPAAASLLAGDFAFAPDRSRNELSSWTSVTRAVLRLPAGTKALETVTVNVPKEASAGEHYAVVWAEVSAPAPAAGGVALVNRVGIRMYLSIGPGGSPPPNFAIGPLTAERSATGEPVVVARIENTGGTTLDVGGTLNLSDGPGGLRAGPFPVKLEGGPLAPDDSELVTVPVDKRLPRGPWRAQMPLTSGVIEREAAATVTFPAAIPPIAKTVPAQPGHLILFLIMLLLLLAVVAFSLLVSRRMRRGVLNDPGGKTAEVVSHESP